MTAQMTENAKAGMQASLEPSPAARTARQMRAVRLSAVAVLLTSSAMVPLHAQTFDIGGGVVAAPDFTGPPLNNATEITNGTLVIDTTAVLAPYTGILSDRFGQLSLTKQGVGTVTLSGTSTYTGLTRILQGTLIAASNAALGSAAGGTTVSIGATLGLQGNITIAEPLLLAGSGVGGNGALRNISGNNLVTGDIVISGGGATIGSDAGILQINGAVNNGGHLLTTTGAGATIFFGAISGNGGLTVEGPGQVDLNGINTYAGITTVNNGILLTNSGAGIIDTGQVVVNGGAFGIFNNETIGSLAGTGGFVSTSAGSGTTTLTVGGNNLSTSYAGNTQNNGLVGLFAINKIGTGTLTLTGNAAHTGGTTISGGALQIGDGGTTGQISGNIINNAALIFNRSNAFTVANLISGSGSLTKLGAGTMTLSGANTYAGLTTVSAGTLIAASNDALGSTTNGTVVNTGATLGLQGNITIGEAITINGTGVGDGGALRNLSGGNIVNGTITLASAARINSDIGVLELRGGISGTNQSLTIGGGGSTNLASPISLGTGTLTKDGTGVLRLLGSNLAAGNLIIQNGDVRFGRSDTAENVAVADSVNVTLNGGSITLERPETIGSLTGTGGVVTTADTAGIRRLTVGGNNLSTTFAGELRDSTLGILAMTKAGTGTLTLTGNSTHSGFTVISQGTIVAGNANALGTGDVTLLNSGTKLVADFNGTFARDLVSDANVTFAAAAGRTVTLTGDILGGLSAVFNFGSATETGTIIFNPALSGNFASSTAFAINGGTLRVDDTIGLNLAGILFSNTQGLTIGSAGTLDLGGFNLGSSKIGGTGTILNSGAASTLTLNNSTFAGTINTGANGITLAGSMAGLGSLTKRGAGTLTLASGLTTTGYSGGLTLAEGTLSLQAGLASGFGTIRTTGSVIDYANGITNAAPIAIDSNTTQLQVTTGSATQSGIISELGGARGFEKIGAGTLVLTGANTYTGTTTVSQGALIAASNGALGTATGGTTVASGATLGLQGAITNFETITIAGDGVGGGGALRNISGNNRLSRVTLAADARIASDAGVLLINTETNNGGNLLTVSGAGTIEFLGVVSGSGGLTVDGASQVDLLGANTFTGTTTVNSGTLRLQGGASLSDAGRLTINSPGVVQVFSGERIGSLDGNGRLSLGTSETFIIGDTTSTTFSGVIDQFAAVGRIEKIGSGTLTLTGNNTYTGTTTITAGTLQIGNGGTTGILGSGAVVNNASLVFNRSNFLSVSNVISGSGSLTKQGTGSLMLTGNNTYSGTTTITEGQLQIGSGGTTGTLGSGDVVNNASLLFNRSDNITVGNAISGTGSLFKLGTGTTILTADNLYGATTIISGTLQIGNGGTTGTLGNGDVVNNASLVFNRSDNLTVANTINGTGSLTKQGAGALTLTGNNAYFGGTNLAGGRIVAGSNTALGTGALTTQGGTVLQLGIATSPGVSAGPITLANAIELAGNSTFNLVGITAGVNSFSGNYNSTGTTATLNGVISDAGSLTITGAGRLTLNGNNTYAGGTDVLQALVEVGHANAFGTGTMTLGSTAALRNTTGSALTLGNNIAVTGIAATIGGTSDFALTGNLSGTGNLSKVQGNTLSINGAVNDFSGALIVNGGTVLVNGTMGNAGAGVTVNNGGTLGGTGTIAGPVIIAFGGTLAAGQSPGTMTVGTLALNSGSNTIFELAQAGLAGGANNDLIRVTGNLALDGGGISVVRGTGFSAGQYTLFEFGSLTGAIGNMTLNPLGAGFSGSLALGTNTVLLNVAGAADQVFWNGSTFAPAGTIVGGNGTWNLTNGNFSNSAGTVSGPWAGNGALAIFGGENAGTVTIANDTVLSPSGLSFTIDGYTIRGGNAGSGLSFAGPTGIEVLAGLGATIEVAIGGAGSLTKNGAGTLRLTGANTYAGDTSILGGTLEIGDGGITGTLGGGNVLNNGALVINRGNDITVANVISGSGSLTKQGGGTLTLSSANTYDGLTTVAAGTLLVTNPAGLGSALGGTVVNAGASLAFSTGLPSFVDEDITINGTGVVGSGALQGRGGSVQIGRAVQLGSDSLITATAGILSINGITGAGRNLTIDGAGAVQINGNLALGSGTLTKDGSGQLALFNANDWTGDFVINGGAVQISSPGGPVNGVIGDNANVTINAGLMVFTENETIGSLAGGAMGFVDDSGLGRTLTVGGNNASTTFAGRINGSLGLTKTGTGTLTLSGNGSTTTGITRIEGGTLALGANDAISNASAVQIAGGTLALGTFTDTVTSVNLSAGSITGGTGSALTVLGNYFQSGGTLAAGATVNVGSPFGLSGGTIAGTLNSTLLSNSAGSVNGTGVLLTGRLTMAGSLSVGSSGSGAGQLTINSGGFARVLETVIGANASSSGLVTVSGVGSRLENTAGLLVGFSGSGNLIVENGGFISSASSFIGAFQPGTAEVRGTGSRWENAGVVNIGLEASGSVTVEDGGFVRSGSVIAGLNPAGTGSMLVTGSGSRWENTGELLLGRNGSGTLTIAAGGAVTAGSLVMAREAGSTGTLTFGAAEGSPAVAAGTLATPTIAFGAGTGSIVFNHTSADFELAAAISGNGTLRQLAGTTTLSGASTFTGTTSVFGGTLRVTGSLASDVVVGAASLVNSGTIGGLVSNAGTLTSTGTLSGGLTNLGGATAAISGTLSGALSNSGTLTLTGATSGIGALTQTASGVFNLAGNSTAIGSLAGAGAVQLGSATLTTGSNNASTLFTGVISGSGGLTKVGSGTLTLRGANTFTGLTTVDAGTLWLDAGGSLAGGVINNGVFINEGSGITGLFVNNGQLSSLTTLRGGLINNAGARAVLGPVIDGNITNAGLVELNPGARGIGSFTQSATGVLDMTRTSIALGSLAGSGSVLLGAQTLTTGSSNADTSFAGVIAGSGGLTKVGTGTFTLSGANTFTGLTTVSAGTLAISASGALAGSVLNTAVLTNAGTIAGAVSNSGTLTNSGTLGGGLVNAAGASAAISGVLTGALENAGTLTLTGATTGIGAVTQGATGVFDLGGNSTAIGSLSGAGQVQLGSAALTAGSNNASTLFSGVIAGSGTLAKAGSGTLVLTGANTYTGTTTITGGALQLGDGGTTGSIAAAAIINNGALILNRSDAITLANAISGSGMLVQAGSGTTRLTAANSYTGGTLVSAGRLVGDAAALQGAIQNNAVLEFAMAAKGTFAGVLAGTGQVEKTGAGILTFAGDGRGLTGPFAVLGGTLRMDSANGGRLDSAVVTLAAGTSLSGNGLIGGLVVEGSALVTPGNSLGVIGVAGDVTFRAASRFLAQITESGADLITAGGAAQLAGTLEVVNLSTAAFRFNTAFTVVEAAGGITGSFDNVTFSGFSPIYRPTLRSTANGLAIVLAPNSLAGLAGSGVTANQAAVAARFDAAVLGGFDPQAFLGLYALAPAQLTAALDQLSGEVHPAMGRAAMRQSRLPREAVLERAAGVALADNPQGNSFGTWAKLMRSWGDVAAAPGTAGQTTDTEGFVIGVDGGTANDARALRFGVYGSYLATRVAIDARGSAGEIQQAGGGVYTSLAAGGFSLVAGAGAARFDITTNRTVALPGLADGTASSSAGDMAQVFGRIGYRFALGAASLEPFVAADHAWITLDPVLERGGATALTAERQEYKVAGATTGLALKAPLGKLRLDAEAAARFELGDRAPEALVAFAAAPGAATRIGAPRLAGTAFTGRLGAVLPITSRIEVRFDYAGEFSSTDTEHTAQAGLSIRF